MRNKLILTVMLLMVAMAMQAIPVKRGQWQTIRLQDGSEVVAQPVGDEYGHWMQAADGSCYVMQENNFFQQVDRQELLARRQTRLTEKKSRRKAIYASTSDGLGKKGTMSKGAVQSIGEYTIPVVMVQFSNLKFKTSTTVEKMEKYYNQEGYTDNYGSVGSVRDYFKAQSGGQFVPTFDVVGIVTLSNTYSYYGKNDSNGNDQHLEELPGDVIDAAISQLGVDFSQYVVPAGDDSHTAGVPLLAMFYAGKGEATEYPNGPNYLWPCEWDDVEDAELGDYHDVHFNSFFIGNELYAGGQDLMGMGIFCHELGHAMGLPDFYCTDESYMDDDAFGMWSIMDSGGYEGGTYAPMGYNAYEKSYMGWLELQEVGDADEVILQSPLGTAENSAYIIRHSNTESFIFENRQPGTFYPEKYGSGVMVSRIAYSYNMWKGNKVNNTQSKKRATILTADGAKLSYSASNSNLYGASKKSIASLKTLNGSSKTIGITNITKNSDGTITLAFNGSVTPDPTPQPSGDYIFYESFDQCAGTGGNDGLWSGSVATSTFSPDNDGWKCYQNKMYGGDKCAKFGTSSAIGAATSPYFELNGEATLTFKAGGWNASADGTKLSLMCIGGEVENKNFEMEKGNWTEFTTTIKGSGEVCLMFTPSKRFFLDEVKVVAATTDGITRVTMSEEKKADRCIFDLSGRYVGTDFRSLPHGIYVVNGRKVVK